MQHVMASVFTDKATRPDRTSLARALGRAGKAWDAISHHLDQDERLVCAWKFYGEKHGWQWKVEHNKRAILYMVPGEGCFTAALGLKEKAVAALRSSQLPPALVREIEVAKAYAEGRPARVAVTGMGEVEIVKQLVALKLNQ
jgi:hypothetical protein